MDRQHLTRLCFVAGVLAAFLAPAAAGSSKNCGSNCKEISLGFKHTAFCALGAKGYASDTRFKPEDFRFTCVGDVSKACDTLDNTIIPGDPQYACCSCYLYNKYSYGAKTKFVTNKDISSNPHVLLIPSAGCTGVENWNRGSCPGETIWDEGRDILVRAGKDAGWGMAINPVSRRSQHQMHVHLAEVYGGLINAIVDAHNKGLTSSYIKCSGKQTSSCTLSAQGDRTSDIQVTLVSASDPGKAQPFFVAYGSHPDNTNALVLRASTLVIRVPKTTDVWAIVTNPTGPAECFFNSTKDHCT